MERVIEALLAERNSLQAKLTRVNAAIEEYERWARSVAGLVGEPTAALIAEPIVRSSAVQTPTAAFEAEVHKLFRDASAPLRRVDVHYALEKAGVVVGGKDPLNTVASRLSRMKGIVNIKGFGYWAQDRAYAPAAYMGKSGSADDSIAEAGAGEPSPAQIADQSGEP